MKKKEFLKTIVKILVSVVLLLVLFYISKDDIGEFKTILSSANLVYAPFILLLIAANYLISSIRWKYLLIHKNAEKVSVWYLTALYFIGSFFNNFMVTSVGGDVYKIYRLGNKIGSKADAFAATFMERFTGVISLVFLSAFGFLGSFFIGSNLEGDISKALMLLAGLFVLMAVGAYVGLVLLKKFKTKATKLEKIYDSLNVYNGKYKVLTIALVTSFIVQGCSIISQILIFSAINVQVDIFKALFIFPLITLASFFIPSLNGLGVQDFLYKLSNTLLMVTQPVAIASSLLYHIARLLVSLIGGVLYAVVKD